ncbi:MAG: hypothetical protein ACRCX2_11965 [Paraclostridium sp.]
MNLFEGQIISFKAFDDIYEGIILEIRDEKVYMFDVYGNSKTITKEDVINSDVELNPNKIKVLVNYFKHYTCSEVIKHQLMMYKKELMRLQQVYKEKYAEYNGVEVKIDSLKKELIKSLDIYTHQNINEKFNNILNNRGKHFTILTDDKHRLVEIRFNRLYTVAKEGTFNVNELKFVNFFEDGNVYIEDESLWSDVAKNQVENIYDESNEGLREKSNMLNHVELKVSDRIILGGPIKDLTIEKEFIFVPNTLSNNKKDIDITLLEVANFSKEYILI